ncbi:glycoside hydrolase family 2 TIM barrel-domain containing protein [Neobacillus sp. YX16]|uniref:glycoside hydrolase family 2 protein n=1 Tax=Neobacillus sp. YX16 TaxID=3047874 RepID=UPI0024C2421D|nr:sugar-binding domain-containing protein [Neobacillus sp. YX16]WHZ01460.1 glycoside hydrolase family 2 TIM barrel-domain containing protein [Neobacillus sp. YX16]
MRKTNYLDGSWNFGIDPKNKGESESWYTGSIPNAISVEVPHIWQREGDQFVSYNGAAWYERQVKIENLSRHHDYYLCFGAVDYSCRVWWNGQFIGEHEGGFTPFEFNIPSTLIKDDNQLSIRVYDYEANAEIPIGKQGSWYTRVSGIWQSVKLEVRAKTFISNVFVTPNIDQDSLEISSFVTGEINESTSINFVIKGHSLRDEQWGDKESISGTLEMVETTLPIFQEANNLTHFKTILHVQDMKRWSPETPYLYEIEVTVESKGKVDSYQTTFGYRKVEQKNGRIYLNNEPIYIRGALDQAFYPDTIYAVPSVEYIQKELQAAKDMGFNLLRKHIKAELPVYLYWADRLGMLIWAEPPNYVKWTATAQKRFVKLLNEMMIRDYNHPSIIIWSIYNEEWGLEWDLEFDVEKQDHVAKLFDEVKRWDTTRLYCDNSGWTHVKTDINDHHRYFALPEQIKEWEYDLDEYVIGQRERNFVTGYQSNGEPLLISEFGMWGLPSIEKLRNYYKGKEPWWFVNQGDGTHQDDYKKPTTALVNHSKFGIREALGDLENLAVSSQKRMFRGVKSLIEEMRKRPQIAGYVVTEFTDIEWETNGWLDFMREPKEEFNRLVDFNGPICVIADISNRNLWSGESTNFDIVVVNDLAHLREVTIKWEFVDANQQPYEKLNGEIHFNMNDETYWKTEDGIYITVPAVSNSEFAQLKLVLISCGHVVASNVEEFTFTNKHAFQKLDSTVYVHHLPQEFSNQLVNHDIEVTSELEKDVIVVTDHLDGEILTHIHTGGHAIFLAEAGDHLEGNGHYPFRKLPPGESWPRASSMNYINTEWFNGVPFHPEVGWEGSELFPDYVIPFADYKKDGTKRTINMFGSPRLAEESNVLAGYFQGWLGQNGGSIVHHRDGKGSVLIITWKLINQYGKHPIATQLLNKLIMKVKGESIYEN